MVSTADLHWLAGLLEGEGCFSHHKSTPVVSLGMTDFDVVERAHRLVPGAGKLAVSIVGQNKPMHRWSVHSRDAIALMMTLYTLMGERRRARITELLVWWQATPGAGTRGRHGRGQRERLASCKRGHLFVGDNIYIDPKLGKRHCNTCRLAATQRSNAKIKER